MGQRIAGVAYLYIAGVMYPLRGNFTVSPSMVERTGLAGQDAVHGYSEVPRIPWVEGDISTLPGLSLMDMQQLTDVTVTCELANDSTYVLTQAWCRAAFEINTREGQFRVRFEGIECREIMSSEVAPIGVPVAA